MIAPVLGGQLNRVMTWRGIFGVLAGIGVALVLAGWLGLKESLPREKRVAGGVLATLRGFAALAKDRFFGVSRSRPGSRARPCSPISQAGPSCSSESTG